MNKKFSASLLTVILCLFSICVLADIYPSSSSFPAGSPFANTNIVGSSVGASGPVLNGGAPATNIVKVNSTNTAIWQTPLDLRQFRSCNFQISFTSASNAVTTNWVFVYPCSDGVTIDTTHVLATYGPLVTSAGNTNFLLNTNLPSSVLGDTGFVMVGWGNQGGSNSTANVSAQAFAKSAPFN